MPCVRLRALLLTAVLAAPALGQGPPSAVLGEPAPQPPLFDITDPLRNIADPLRTLGPPDQPFRPVAPLGPPASPAAEGIGTRFGLGILVGRYGIPGYGLMWIPAQPVAGQPTDLGAFRQELSLFAPIFHDGPDTAAVGLGIRNTIFSTDAILPTSGRSFPSMLWDIEAGVAYAHQWDNGWTTGAVVSVGSASDKPFTEGNTLVASLSLYTAFPTVDRDAWILGLSYSPTSDFPYPLPIVAYYWEPNENLQMSIGLPFFVKWRFLPEWVFDGLWVPIRTVSAKVTWDAADLGGARPYAAFDWSNESYFLANRPDDQDRFYSYEKRLYGGVQLDLPYRLRLDLSAGYVFDRFYFQGKKYADRDRDRVNVGSGPFFAAQLRLQF
jgi:hypothetical protein